MLLEGTASGAWPENPRRSANKPSLWLRTCIGAMTIVFAVVCVVKSTGKTEQSDENNMTASRNSDIIDLALSRLYVAHNRAKLESQKSARLFSWINSFDDGKGITTSGQHGGTQTISDCDADDPRCTYHVSPDADYSKSYWTGPGVERHDMSVKVDSDHIMPSSYENDIGDGQMATVARTSERSGQFRKRSESVPKYDIEVIHPEVDTPVHRIIRVGVPRIDRDSERKLEVRRGDETIEDDREIGDYSRSDRDAFLRIPRSLVSAGDKEQSVEDHQENEESSVKGQEAENVQEESSGDKQEDADKDAESEEHPEEQGSAPEEERVEEEKKDDNAETEDANGDESAEEEKKDDKPETEKANGADAPDEETKPPGDDNEANTGTVSADDVLPVSSDGDKSDSAPEDGSSGAKSSEVSGLRDIGEEIASAGEQYAAVHSKLAKLRAEESAEASQEAKIARFLRDLTSKQEALLSRLEKGAARLEEPAPSPAAIDTTDTEMPPEEPDSPPAEPKDETDMPPEDPESPPTEPKDETEMPKEDPETPPAEPKDETDMPPEDPESPPSVPEETEFPPENAVSRPAEPSVRTSAPRAGLAASQRNDSKEQRSPTRENIALQMPQNHGVEYRADDAAQQP